MYCFYHQSITSVGICKACGKGICSDCAVDLGKGLACKGRCEHDAQEVIEMIERNIRLAPISEQMVLAARRRRNVLPTTAIAFGLLFFYLSYQSFSQEGADAGDIVLFVLAMVFLVGGVSGLVRSIVTTRYLREIQNQRAVRRS